MAVVSLDDRRRWYSRWMSAEEARAEKDSGRYLVRAIECRHAPDGTQYRLMFQRQSAEREPLSMAFASWGVPVYVAVANA